jgi:hypothetical protein
MDRFNSRIAQVYGYAVCLITVVVVKILRCRSVSLSLSG